MGVDFFPCDYCEDTICDAGDFVSCNECGRSWCDERCGAHGGLKFQRCDDCETDDEAEECGCLEEAVCGYCRKEMVTDYDLLNYALKGLDMSRDELADEYLAQC